MADAAMEDTLPDEEAWDEKEDTEQEGSEEPDPEGEAGEEEQEAGEEGSGSDAADEEAEFARIASMLGWVPEDKWRGPKEGWTDARTFLQRTPEVIAQMKRTNRDLVEKVQRFEERFNQLDESQQQRERERIEQSLQALESQRDEALEENDVRRYHEVTRKIEEQRQKQSQTEKSKPAEPAKTDAPQPDNIPPELADWGARNSWYGSDMLMSSFANAVRDQVRSQNPQASTAEILAAIDREMPQRFPEKFDNPNRRQPAKTETAAGRGAGRGKPAKGFSDIPASDQDAVRQYIAAGLASNLNEAAKLYWEN